MTQRYIKAVIRGHVQGVGFRYSTQHQALRLGLTGYAKNLYDGTVEVVACGEAEVVQQLLDWLQHGPRTARVTAVDWQEVPAQDYKTFGTG